MNQVSTTNKGATKASKGSAASSKASKGFTAEEKAAVRQRAKELKASEDAAEAAKAVDTEIESMSEPDRTMARRLHKLIMTNVPGLTTRTWYGFPAYYKDGKQICFYQTAQKFKTRYATFGFAENANLDDGNMWPVAYALKKLTASDEARILALVKQAIGRA